MTNIPTVADYFKQQLGEELEPDPPHAPHDHENSPYHPEFTVETGCGEECKLAIDAGKQFLHHSQSAHGSRDKAEIIKVIRGIVLCYVYG